MKAIKIIWRVLQSVLLVLLSVILLCNLYVIGAKALLHEENPTVFGWSWAVILSGSMEPEIRLDDLIVNKAQDGYEVGDIITVENGSSLTTHRIVGETEEGFITKGDANNTEDTSPVAQERIVGKVVFSVPKVGLVIGYLKTPLGMLCMVLLGFCLIEIPYLLEKRKNE